jgi:hypothetical protein
VYSDDGVPGDDGDGKGCSEAGIAPDKNPTDSNGNGDPAQFAPAQSADDVTNVYAILGSGVDTIARYLPNSIVSSLFVPTKKSTWAWDFAKSFFTFAGGPGNLPTCAGQALRHMGETLNPFTPSPSTVAEAAAPVVQAVAINQGIAQTHAGIDAYIATRGLSVPLRSSIVRTMAAEGAEGAVAAGARANLAVQTLAVDYAAISSTITTAGEVRNGQCAAALPIF